MPRESDNGLLLASVALILAVMVLCGIGLVILNSAGAGKSELHSIIFQQLKFMCVAVAALFAAAFINLQKLKEFAFPIAVIALIALALVLIPGVGKEVNGSRRWIDLGIAAVQPSDFAKIALVIAMSAFLHENQRHVEDFLTGIFKPFVIIGLFCSLIIFEPDFGTTALCGMVGVCMMFLAGCNKKILFGILSAAIAAGSILVYLNPVRRERVLAFLDIENTKLEGSYQLYQAILGFGVGGVDGVGIGRGRQQLSFLPEAHTDFIFAIVGEELGMVFTVIVVLMFAVVFFATVWSLRRAQNKFEFFMAAGAVFMIVFQAIFNLCVVTGLMPTKGISLPFISYGGSNLVEMSVFVGIILNCMRSWSRPAKIRVVEYE